MTNPIISDRDCGCRVRKEGRQGGSYYIEYCPVHTAAPALLEACKRSLSLLRTHPGDAKYTIQNLEAALALAEPK